MDLERFLPSPFKNHNSFLMIARLTPTKGVFEFCEAARIVKEKYPEASFNLLGAEGLIKKEDLAEYTDKGIVSYLGYTNDVRPYIEDTAVSVLPSYREGLSTVNVEASAFGRPVITCDANGMRETVADGQSGFLVPVKNAEALSEKMIYFLENPEKIEEMGKNARKYVEEKFDQRKINQQICDIIFKN